MDRRYTGQIIKEPDSPELYHHIYEFAQKDYKTVRMRIFARRSLYLFILFLSAAGLFFTIFYFIFLQDHLKALKNQLQQYSNNIKNLYSEIDKLTASEMEYRGRLQVYKDTFSKLKIEDNRIVDFDLTESVQKYVEKYDDIPKIYKNIYRGNTGLRETALTFDLGTGEDSPYIYAVLKKAGVKATIFISNEMPATNYGALFSDKNVSSLIKFSKLGCEFGNHTWSHYNLKTSLYETSRRKRLNLSFISDEILDEVTLKLEFDRVKDKFYRETGIMLSSFWRAPYGAIDRRILTIAAKAGYSNHVFWSSNKCGPLDFYDYITKRTIRIKDKKSGHYTRRKNPLYFSSSEMLARLKKWEKVDPHGLNGAIAISHLGTARKADKMVHILPEYISYFQKKGYHFVLISEIINNKKD